MTKTLTEQWREGTLPDGCYYVRFFTKKQHYIEICGSEYLGNLAEFNGTDRAEVLALVPSYDEYKRLQAQLKEANDLLKAYALESLWESLSLSYDEANEYCKKWGVK